MTNPDQRYQIQQNKTTEPGMPNQPPVFAKLMLSKEGVFEGVSFIKNKDKASVMTLAQAQQAIAWASARKARSDEYVSKIICLGQ